MAKHAALRTADFNEKVCTYWLLSGVLVLALTVVGIVLVPVWLIAGLVVTKRYLARMSCVLTEGTLEVKKGWLVRVEKTVPLEKITDVGMVQGPVMRWMGLRKLTFETAGQSGQGALVSMTGIVDAEGFREAVLEQRDAFAVGINSGKRGGEGGAEGSAGVGASGGGGGDQAALLGEIRDVLVRIEGRLVER